MDHISAYSTTRPHPWHPPIPAPAGGYLHAGPETSGIADHIGNPGTLGSLTAGQLRRLCAVAGLGPAAADGYARTLVGALGPVADRPLDLPPVTPTFLSDDHTPVEYSLSFTPGAAPALRVLLEPGCGAGSLARSGRAGLAAVREMARRWNFSTAVLDELEDLFLPPAPEGPLALWCALELRPGGVPKVKVYLNPAARGAGRAAATVREALRRLGHRRAFDALPAADGHLFFALDLGDWDEPRLKVYLAHQDLTARAAGGLSRMDPGPGEAEIRAFFHLATGTGTGPDLGAGTVGGTGAVRLDRRPGQSCHAFTETASGRPSGFTLYIPVRDYARDDEEALARAEAVLDRYGMDPVPLLAAVPALTARRPADGVGLVAYLGLAHQQGRPPRVTVYLSAEAYAVRPPAGTPTACPEPVS
ncbi:tryptophan dimethylallyltransferase family protein [Streptomyces griseosporeus]|uniref:tryptophan dimethylallyltransferase family protein n=1 Tax=Streptomyces griseosporeus TaxID=1910 RepID=UPI00199FADD5|nr:tryptophan dimethylallyltransferase family protein [Streptomyces griseosporeus]GHF90261.1 prenyltransferase [Streptomyces griseosporeus]